MKFKHAIHGDFDLIQKRLKDRRGHFMSSELLQSQFDTLEHPSDAIAIDIISKPTEIIKMIKENLSDKGEFGLYGLGVMGKSLSRNLARNGFKISLYNRHVDGKEEKVAVRFKKEHDELSDALPFDKEKEFIDSLQTPRKIMLMVPAAAMDKVIEVLVPLLSEGDILIDGGNSNFKKTNDRADYLKSKKINYIGAGVSGGEEGALKGPSIMPGGDKDAYESVAPYLNAIAAKDDHDLPCCAYVGPQGSGHYVKTIHNGIEYAEMQLLCEVYGILKSIGKNQDDIASILTTWKATESSYLLEITIDILQAKEGESWLLEKIMDQAGNKGTGNWATISSAELGVPSTLIASALFARYTSFYKEDRVKLNEIYGDPKSEGSAITNDELLNAYSFCRIVNHYQGFKVISKASEAFGWNLNLSEIARIWTNGCIIRSSLMKELVNILKDSEEMLTDQIIIDRIQQSKPAANKVISKSLMHGQTIPCMSEAVNFFNAMTSARSTANLIQAQRDYFGAHTYQRIDDDSDKFYHTNWK